MGEILGDMHGEATSLDYLMLWIGVVGVAVGLNLPKDMVVRMKGRHERGS